VPRKIRDILNDYRKAGFVIVPGAGKGDHRKLKHAGLGGAVTLDGKLGSDCKHYQEKQLREQLEKLKK
jgi:predicted RNA binding protein YcfA (HicA-like mRNA interferase family)